jgi:NADPH-dependent glutamate synthase beta subunit-like oxidoreductase
MSACPAHINGPEDVRLISVGDYKYALSVIRQRVPVTGVLGRVCTKPCESACSEAGHVTHAISIKMLKWFLADSVALEEEPKREKVVFLGHP